MVFPVGIFFFLTAFSGKRKTGSSYLSSRRGSQSFLPWTNKPRVAFRNRKSSFVLNYTILAKNKEYYKKAKKFSVIVLLLSHSVCFRKKRCGCDKMNRRLMDRIWCWNREFPQFDWIDSVRDGFWCVGGVPTHFYQRENRRDRITMGEFPHKSEKKWRKPAPLSTKNHAKSWIKPDLHWDGTIAFCSAFRFIRHNL